MTAADLKPACEAVPAQLSIECPVCRQSVDFNFDQLSEDVCGNWWSVSDEHRFDHCLGCGTFVDYGTVAFKLEREHG